MFRYISFLLSFFIFTTSSSIHAAPTPIVQMNPVVFSLTQANFSASVNSYGGAYIMDEGVVYSTTPNPTINGPHVSAGTHSPSFNVSVSNLQYGVFYYARAYAKVGPNIGYSNTQTFTYADPMITKNVNQITDNSAVFSGNTAVNISGPVTGRGFVYSTSVNPTTANFVLKAGSGVGSFQASAYNLQGHQTYYVRAYGIGQGKTVYGQQVSFTTLSAPIYSTISFTGVRPGTNFINYTESGYTVAGLVDGVLCTQASSRCIIVGNAYLTPAANYIYPAASTQTFKLTSNNGVPFSLNSVMLTGFTNTTPAQTVTFTGYQANGSTVTYSITTPAFAYAFKSYSLPSSFSNLSYVTWQPSTTGMTDIKLTQELMN